MPRNAPFGVAAGSPNYAQGGVRDRFRAYVDAFRASGAQLMGAPQQLYLPTWAPYKNAWERDPWNGSMEPEDAIAAGAFEIDRNVWGGTYYGYHPYLESGYDGELDDASYATMPLGYDDPLYDPDQDLWHYSLPVDAMPNVEEREPYAAAHYRANDRGGATHPSRADDGFAYGHGHEDVDFTGTST